ncbi:MAG: hydrogenase accessory protein HypB [Spirochaetaceae bacterium]|nr:MAG: hydrogenase accessory protein HypB [Spirochaetaceae bacterium]
MAETRIVRIRESVLRENRVQASILRKRLAASGVVMVNLMSSPGSGKTSIILHTIAALRERFRIAVIEADIDSTVDADKMIAAGVPAVQIETGGFCHVDAAMAQAAIQELPLNTLDVLFLENVGNLICTAQHDTGAHVNVAILSVPEGDDKPLKYPVMFQAADVVIVNKTDYMAIAEFDINAVRQRIAVLNQAVTILPVSCRSGEGIADWIEWLTARITSVAGNR